MKVRRSRFWILAGAALVLVSLLSVACNAGKPKIELPQTEHDFGEVHQGDVVTVTLPVRNVGAADLQVTSVMTSCSCTSAKVEPKVIPPNGEGTLTAWYNSGLHPDKGPIWRVVYIKTNDPETPEARVDIKAVVVVP